MAIHHKDLKRNKDLKRKISKLFRLLGVNSEGRPSFYWSDEKGKFAAYLGPSSPYGVWGTLVCPDGKRMKPENRVFIADYETARRLEILRVVRPCGNCNKGEFKRYNADKTLTVDRHVVIE